MGLFDTVYIEVELPDGYKGKEFQTKDLDCLLDEIKITADGKLMRLHYDLVKSDQTSGKREWPIFKRENEEWRPLILRDRPFHGIMEFYTREKDIWYEYEAKFTDGQLVEIIKVERRIK